MNDFLCRRTPHASILLLAEIKNAIRIFDDGDANVDETLRAIALLLACEVPHTVPLNTRDAA
jgi:hypothetical protein